MSEELMNNEEIRLDNFFNVFDHFVETLQRGKISLGTEYIVPLDTDFEKWIYDFGYNTHTSYVQVRTEYNTGNIEFRYTYKCHRSGKYNSQAGQNSTKKARINQKDSKKIGCESTIIITKTKGNCSQMIIKYTSHSNHILGSDNNIGTLRLSKQIRDYIAQRMRDGLDVKTISQIFRMRAHDLDKIWNQQGDNNEDKGQLLGFIVPIAKEIIHQVNTILLDATHGTNKNNDQLYTLLTPDFKTGKGLPLAHLISSRKNTASVQFWLYNLHIQLSWEGPISFLVNCDLAQIKALRNIFPRSRILLCWWHVLKAWRENLKKVYIKKANTTLNGKLNSEIKKKLKDELWDDLRELMYINNHENVDECINNFLNKWSDLKLFILYFKKQWLNKLNNNYQASGINKTMWIKVYRLDIPNNNINTTNMLESWYRKLKYDIFNGKPNRCRDILIYELYINGNSDAKQQWRLAEIRAGRMMPAE
ncbi:10308_t:CDS:2 [Dentiscutata heterogama]|uniref:10308_t:CDS:1 n=1 Tax=Dentiscutata heterogama TaxID=1316150 RepID=A0ACA9LHA1_9GLOM|nr:10308_t:CDS:2 [Dentiscutata heterogama]